MRNIVAFPVLGLAVILQASIVSQIRLLSGYGDLPLVILAAWALQDRVESAWHWAILASLMVGFISAMAWPVIVIGYLAAVFFAQVLQKRVWQAPLLAMFSVTFAGTILMNVFSYVVLRILGTPLSAGDVAGLITLPGLLLNILFAIPVYTIMRDLARWVYPSAEYA